MAEGAGLLNRFTVKSRNGGSNPPLSATFTILAAEAAGLFTVAAAFTPQELLP